jgi:hypothetical protein
MKVRTNCPQIYRHRFVRRSEQGQSYLEFALILPVLLLMLIGVAIMSQGFNLQMVLNGAAYEGARVWAKDPAGGDNGHCTPPACDPNSAQAINFEKYVIPVVRQYVTNNGFKGSDVMFFSQTKSGYEKALSLISDDPQLVRVTLLYPYELPIGNFAAGYEKILVEATCVLKRGS